MVTKSIYFLSYELHLFLASFIVASTKFNAFDNLGKKFIVSSQLSTFISNSFKETFSDVKQFLVLRGCILRFNFLHDIWVWTLKWSVNIMSRFNNSTTVIFGFSLLSNTRSRAISESDGNANYAFREGKMSQISLRWRFLQKTAYFDFQECTFLHLQNFLFSFFHRFSYL